MTNSEIKKELQLASDYLMYAEGHITKIGSKAFELQLERDYRSNEKGYSDDISMAKIRDVINIVNTTCKELDYYNDEKDRFNEVYNYIYEQLERTDITFFVKEYLIESLRIYIEELIQVVDEQ
ncbi:MAG: hypothetical protein ILA19_02955 [Bacilli bacterium]|nr:hypothetical protein [Bacilli bacterium]